MGLLSLLMNQTGETKVPRYAQETFGAKNVVSYSAEFRRIEKIPRRQWNVEPLISNIQKLFTEDLKVPGGSMELWKIQAGALADILSFGGGFLPVGVGQGKALISLLAPVVLEAERPVLFVPAALRDQTLQYVLPDMRKHWRLHPHLRVLGYSELSLAKNAKLLEELQPDLIVLDECHNVSRTNSGRTRRLVRYFRAFPKTKCVAMSGTVSKRSIKDFGHIVQWCLKENTPLPEKWQELTTWADAIDGTTNEDGILTASPGALLRFCEEGENVRQGFRRRLVDTPGVVASKENDLGVSLRITGIKNLTLPDHLWSVIERTRNLWETPDGDIITEAVALWRHIRQLALGFWYKWDPAPPREWMDARREWKRYVRETLKNNRRGLDTELQVWNESEARGDQIIWREWKAIKGTFKPNTVPVWESEDVVDMCCGWALQDVLDQKKTGIIWVEHPVFGEAIRNVLNIPYFGAGDSGILKMKDPVVVASISAHGEGKNLQKYQKNLVVSPPSSGRTWEQLLGRTHREGQEADEVEVDVYLHVGELEEAFDRARADARFLEDTLGNRQKLNYANIVV